MSNNDIVFTRSFISLIPLQMPNLSTFDINFQRHQSKLTCARKLKLCSRRDSVQSLAALISLWSWKMVMVLWPRLNCFMSEWRDTFCFSFYLVNLFSCRKASVGGYLILFDFTSKGIIWLLWKTFFRPNESNFQRNPLQVVTFATDSINCHLF